MTLNGVKLILCTVTLMLFALATPQPANASRVEEMTIEQAGHEYTKAFCKELRGWEKFTRTVWHGQDRISEPELRLRFPGIKRASAKYARSIGDAARQMFNPSGGAWPAVALPLVTKVANFNATQAYLRQRQGFASTPRRWLVLNGRANAGFDRQGSTAARLHAILNLPTEISC